jgi:hypothetical protein
VKVAKDRFNPLRAYVTASERKAIAANAEPREIRVHADRVAFAKWVEDHAGDTIRAAAADATNWAELHQAPGFAWPGNETMRCRVGGGPRKGKQDSDQSERDRSGDEHEIDDSAAGTVRGANRNPPGPRGIRQSSPRSHAGDRKTVGSLQDAADVGHRRKDVGHS